MTKINLSNLSENIGGIALVGNLDLGFHHQDLKRSMQNFYESLAKWRKKEVCKFDKDSISRYSVPRTYTQDSTYTVTYRAWIHLGAKSLGDVSWNWVCFNYYSIKGYTALLCFFQMSIPQQSKSQFPSFTCLVHNFQNL